MNNDILKQIRRVLYEDSSNQDIIMLSVSANDEFTSKIHVVGFDHAISREVSGFGGEDDKEKGSWKVLGLPEKSDTGMHNPSPWQLFMDWLWKLLNDKGLNPDPKYGFGPLPKKGDTKTVSMRRRMKYGAHMPQDQENLDVKKYVTIIVDSLGADNVEVMNKFEAILNGASKPSWFEIVKEDPTSKFSADRWFVRVSVDASMPEGWKERKDAYETYAGSAREKWKNALSELAGGRTNLYYLGKVVTDMLIKKYGFAPFHVDILKPELLDKALGIIKSVTLNDVIQYANETNQTLAVEPDKRMTGVPQIRLWGKFRKMVQALADQAGVDFYKMMAAISDLMVKSYGYIAPFDLDKLSEVELRRAYKLMKDVTLEQVKPLLESVDEYVKQMLSEAGPCYYPYNVKITYCKNCNHSQHEDRCTFTDPDSTVCNCNDPDNTGVDQY